MVKVNCTKSRHLKSALVLFCIVLSTFAQAQRAPASYIPRDDVEPAPAARETWATNIFVRDSAGVLDNIGNTFAIWREREEYARHWNLRSTGRYDVPDGEHRRAFFQRQLLRYVDKRVTGEIKAAGKNSTLHKIAQVQNSLRPSTEAQISRNIRVKFKARVLRGRLIMRVDNPWVDYNTEFSLTGNIDMWVHRKIEWANVTTRLNFQPLEGTYFAEIDRPLVKNIVARYSYRQPAGNGSGENIIRLMYGRAF